MDKIVLEITDLELQGLLEVYRETTRILGNKVDRLQEENKQLKEELGTARNDVVYLREQFTNEQNKYTQCWQELKAANERINK